MARRTSAGTVAAAALISSREISSGGRRVELLREREERAIAAAAHAVDDAATRRSNAGLLTDRASSTRSSAFVGSIRDASALRASSLLHLALLRDRRGAPPPRELTPMPRLGSSCPRLGMAAGALPLALGPPPPRAAIWRSCETSPKPGEGVHPRAIDAMPAQLCSLPRAPRPRSKHNLVERVLDDALRVGASSDAGSDRGRSSLR